MHSTGLSDMDNDDIRINLAQRYVDLLQQGDETASRDVLAELCKLDGGDDVGASVYAEVGKLTREMHESICNFVSYSRIQMMTSEDMPDARQRLNHVIETTEQSAHRTMEVIESSSPLLSRLAERSIEIQKLLNTYYSRCEESNGLKLMQEELSDFVQTVANDTRRVNSSLNDIMMAQGYQDLTGQVIQRVIKLVQEVENGLISILKIGSDPVHRAMTDEEIKEADRKGHGPSVPGVASTDVVSSQDEVDDLLSSLGF